MSHGIQIIGDEIFHDGTLVAILTTGVPPTIMDRFTDKLEECDLRPKEGDETKPRDVLGELLEKATKIARGGLLRLPDLARIVASLKECTA